MSGSKWPEQYKVYTSQWPPSASPSSGRCTHNAGLPESFRRSGNKWR